MLCHHEEETGHCLALSFSDLSVWCFSCDSYLDVQAILELRPSCTFVEVWRTPFQSLEKKYSTSNIFGFGDWTS
uniref:UBP-type domain-containing protein n=1 Tax=Zea mays TaxID=4577 RepID=A0A804PSH2_MAIZE